MFSSTKQGYKPKAGVKSKWHRKLKKLWRKNPFCPYCDTLTDITDRAKANGKQKSDDATLDHLYSNVDIRRLANGGNKSILSCYKCNHMRGKLDHHIAYPNLYDTRNNCISIIELLQNHMLVVELNTNCIEGRNCKATDFMKMQRHMKYLRWLAK